MEDNLTYIPMEPAFQQETRERYTKPFKRNVRALIVALVVMYCLIIGGQLIFGDDGNKISIAPIAVITVVFLFILWMAYPKFKKMNIHYLEDADFGMIAKEKVSVINVFDTPSGINIYWLNSATIKSFTPDPYRIFREGDAVVIYYLKHSAEYLAYELC